MAKIFLYHNRRLTLDPKIALWNRNVCLEESQSSGRLICYLWRVAGCTCFEKASCRDLVDKAARLVATAEHQILVFNEIKESALIMTSEILTAAC
jgi:hypothetical protein